MIPWAIFITVAAAFVFSHLATSFSKRLAVRIGWLDAPSQHKAHAKATPLLGGSAVFATVLVLGLLWAALARIWSAWGIPAWLSARAPDLAVHVPGAAMQAPRAMGILGFAALLHVVGLIDDRRHLGPWSKLLAQVAAAAGVVLLCDVRVLRFAGPAVSISASIFWLVLITNSFNFLDNMDGLAAGVAAICTAALLAAALSMGQWFVAGGACVLLGALLGFLRHNFPPADVFMGDAGSLPVGFLLGVLCCLTTYVHVGEAGILYGVFMPVLLTAVPLYDTASVLWIRLREGRNPMVGDRRHFSHRLVRRGMTPRTAVLTIYLCTACTAISASLLPYVRGAAPAAMLAGQTLLILLVIALLEGTEKK
ncbi:MAG: undecaprenyl/decaprenyl-phosphate alpha-N-acetylglucosaminyl 1-phosphate transferase, partial [Phycisphaerae bacterium]|nr:undecaprenyl/decaprenyl-phosphate alpha-N-acetylglucosaminyl 1-phosphate transferase [Phycisphaerae bacterium]